MLFARLKGLSLGVIDGNDLAQASDIKDVSIMFAQSEGQEVLLLPVDANEQGNQQADPATVHVL